MFRTGTISLVLVLVTGAGNIEGKANQEQEEPQQQLHVRVYDYAQVSPEVLVEAKRAAGSIFRRIGVEILWTDHFLNGSAVKRSVGLGSGQRSLQLRVLDRKMSKRLAVNKTMTGLAFQGTGGELGKVANVFYGRVEELAGSKLCSKGEVLGHASAHELGHLLLGNLDHSSTGLMRATLGPKELQGAARGDLVFTEPQAVLIRKTLAPSLSQQ